LQLVSIVFETERLRAVAWRDEHAETAHAAYSQPDFVRYLGNSQPHPDLAHTRRWIVRINELNAGKRDGFWAVELRGTGELVGATLCHPVPGGEGEHEIGWHIFPAHQSNGYATEIGRGAAAYGFGDFYIGAPLGPDPLEAAKLLCDQVIGEVWPERMLRA